MKLHCKTTRSKPETSKIGARKVQYRVQDLQNRPQELPKRAESSQGPPKSTPGAPNALPRRLKIVLGPPTSTLGRPKVIPGTSGSLPPTSRQPPVVSPRLLYWLRWRSQCSILTSKPSPVGCPQGRKLTHGGVRSVSAQPAASKIELISS